MEKQILKTALHGRPAHVETGTVFNGLDWESAGKKPAGAPHSIWEQLVHMIYWQEYMLTELRGEIPVSPEHASESWPAEQAPSGEKLWKETVERFLQGLQEAQQEAEKDLGENVVEDRSRMSLLMTIIMHNSYHAGQVAYLRRMIGAWPPPEGGDTW
ncbi:DinB family protein [Indiicoccus explosivorum]|uniref:DinB family protein n=1 Tax=Indiicoccus explosivorum TaxID=1917864 RepID=UPI000B44F969|nr:DinB family protein [Indiicoccus explosivorum]